jgi:hypothetical protein
LLWVALGFIVFGVVAAAPWNLTGMFYFQPPLYLWPADKTYLAPLRLAHVVALFYVFVFFVRPQAPLLGARVAAPLMWAGRHSLPVYVVGVVLSCAGYFAVTESAGAPMMHAAVNFVGIAVLLGLATALEWHRAARGAPLARTAMLARPAS